MSFFRCILCLIWLGGSCSLSAPISLYSDQEVSRTGCFKLNWEITDPSRVSPESPFLIHVSKNPEFRRFEKYYTGLDKTTFISGLRDGEYFYRVGVMGSEGHFKWSETVKVEVDHYSIQLALILFVLGAIVFASTAFVVLKGYKEKVL